MLYLIFDQNCIKACLTFNQRQGKMKRIVDSYLREWKDDSYRKPLLLRGARQIGKTFAARELGKLFPHFVEINLENYSESERIFQGNLEPERILQEFSLITKQSIIPGKTLLFIDEIQAVPRAIIALRYFYEIMPELHVIAAGSLMDFAIEQVGMPVGRIQSFYMHPMSFMEFLSALGYGLIIKEILVHDTTQEMSSVIHDKILRLLAEYHAIGGMPEAVYFWKNEKEALRVTNVHKTLLDTYRQDFNKYAKKREVERVALLFEQIPLQMGQKFKYSQVEGEYRKRELAPALDLLVTAGVATKVFSSAGQGVPLGAQMDVQDYRVIFLDIGLSQSMLGLSLNEWFLNPGGAFVNKGSFTESFVGQEILAYINPMYKKDLYYWHSPARGSQAEIDYLVQKEDKVVPIEVKGGTGRTLKSLHIFLESHKASTYGVRFSTLNYHQYENIYSYPLYAVAKVIGVDQPEMKKALEYLAS